MALLLHAPNIHTGGGLSLLKAIIYAPNYNVSWAQFDKRALEILPELTDVQCVSPWLFSRFYAEWRLFRAAKKEDTILCLHGLPPLLPTSAKTVVLLHNRLLVTDTTLNDYPLRVRVRIRLERLWLNLCRHHVDLYLVQTPSMAEDFRCRFGTSVPVEIFPFAALPAKKNTRAKMYDFTYVSSGDAHKNHRTLLDAWKLLAEQNLRPSLALTIDASRYSELSERISQMSREFSLEIFNLGSLSSTAVDELYASSGALIFPSQLESFGLPLLEAAQHGLPILAPELDYVRDIVVPIETFDAKSAVSIARAIQRFMKQPSAPLSIHSAEAFLVKIMNS